MKKLLLSFAVILSLLILVSCPDGMPTAILDVSIQLEEGSEISLERFEKLSYTIRDVSGGGEFTKEFPTISKIPITMPSSGEYEITITGTAEEGDLVYMCSGSETITVSSNEMTTKVEIILKITTAPKYSSFTVSLTDGIEKSEEYDLKIDTIDCLVTSGEKQLFQIDGGKYSENTTLEISVPFGVTELEYSVSAKNEGGIVIGGSAGTIKIEETVSYSISILEKKGKGTLKVSVTKDSDAAFPPLKVEDKEYPIEATDGSDTEGSISIDLDNERYSISIGEEEVEVRIVAGMTKDISFDFSTPLIPVGFVDNIIKGGNYNLTISKIDYSFPDLGEEYTVEGATYNDDLTVSIPKVEGKYAYTVSAYNSDNTLIGEASGKLVIEENTDTLSIDIEEKEGEGTIVVSVTKERDALFLPVIIDGTEYPVVAVGDSVTEGRVLITLQSGNYTVNICGEDIAVRIVSGQVRNINYNYATPLLTVTLRDRIVKSEDHDLKIAKIDYTFPDFEDKYSGTGVDYTENLNIRIPKINGSFEYSVIAYNEAGTIIGEGKGSLTIDDDTKISAILIKEKTGNATIKFELTKNADEYFPTIRVGNDYVEITESEDKTKGSGSFPVKNGTYKIYVGSKLVDEVRVVYDEEKTLEYDFTEYYLYLNFVDKINKDNADGLNLVIDTLEVSFKDSDFVIKPKYDTSPKTIVIANSDYTLNVKAKNSEGVVIGEGSGSCPLDDGKREYTIDISEREGNGTLVVNAKRDPGKDFPSISIGEKTYGFTELDNTNGKATIELKKGTYTVNCDGEEKTIRIAADQTNTIEYDFTNPVVITLKDGIPKYEGFDMDIATIKYTIKSLNNKECKYDGKVTRRDNFEVQVSFVSGLWEYDIVAYNNNGIEIGEAKYAFLMKNNTPSITIEEKAGKGSANISLKFNSNVSDPSVSISSNDPINLVKDGDVWKASISDIDSGIYSLNIDGKEFALRIVNGFTTEFSEDLRYSIDVSVENGITSSQEFTISLSSAGKNGGVSASLSDVPTEAEVTWYLGSDKIGTVSKLYNLPDVGTGFYTLKAVVTKSGKVIGIAACVVEV